MNNEVLTKVEGHRSYFFPIFFGVGSEVLLGIASILLIIFGKALGEIGIKVMTYAIAILATIVIPIMIYLIIRTRRLNNTSGREVTFNEAKDAIEFKDIANHTYEIKIKDIISFKGEDILKISYHVYSAKTTATIGYTSKEEVERINKIIKDLQ